jgi:tRNA A-37 threonylcarbamoyl transferase component Bud32
MDAGEVLKNGRTCCVSRLTWNGNDVVIKRYNHKELFHSLRHTIKSSRARSCWIHGLRLGMLHIPTPKPMFFIERRKGFLIWESYLATEYVEGWRLYDFLRDENITEQQRLRVKQKVQELLDEMARNRITHGDLKHTNILITDDGPILTDLDSMKLHRISWLYRIKRDKDIERFNRK